MTARRVRIVGTRAAVVTAKVSICDVTSVTRYVNYKMLTDIKAKNLKVCAVVGLEN